MEYESIVRELKQYNMSEIVLRAYYNAIHENTNEALDAFWARFKNTAFLESGIRLYEFFPQGFPNHPDGPPDFIDDDEFFSEHSIDDIYIGKHNRYTPAFVHKQSFFEINYVLSGSCTRTFEMETVTLRAGDVCIVAPDIYHSLSVFDDTIVLYILLRKKAFNHFLTGMLTTNNILSGFFFENLYSKQRSKYLIFHAEQENSSIPDETIRGLFLRLYAENKNKTEQSILIKNACIMEVFAHLLIHHSNNILCSHKSGESDFQYQLFNYISERLTTVTLTEVAQHFNYTPNYCTALIKKETGWTFSDLLRIFRVKKAERLLINTDSTITDIAAMVGYENSNAFIRAFKKTYHITPNEYRKTKSLV